jgi:hypothetical protein
MWTHPRLVGREKFEVRKTLKGLFLKAVLLPMAFVPVLLRADVVFSNVTGTGTVTAGASVCGPTSNACRFSDTFVGEEFTPVANYTMVDAQAFIFANGLGDNQTFDVFLYSNTGGVPGSVIEQIGFGLAATTPFPGSLITANTINTPITLTSGTPYWLVLEPHLANSTVLWADGGPSFIPESASFNGGQNWAAGNNSTLQFQIDGAPVAAAVPEPSSFVLLPGIVALFCGFKRRNSKTS